VTIVYQLIVAVPLFFKKKPKIIQFSFGVQVELSYLHVINQKMDNQIPWNQLILKLRNSPDFQQDEFERWISASADNQKLWNDLKDIYALSGVIPAYFQPKEDIAWEKINKKISKPVKRFVITHFVFRFAASILLVALGIGGNWLYNKTYQKPSTQTQTYSEVYSPFGHRTMVTLPDGSTVWLNGDSHLKYQNDFSISRNVELSGEAMFKVHKNPETLFTVKTKEFSVAVYGTTFNLRSYPEDIKSELSLIEGSIGLYRKEKLISKMNAGEVISYNNTSAKFNKSHPLDMTPITSWNSDELTIENKSMDEICQFLERWYGVDIELNKKDGTDQRLSFKVKTESLRELLWIIDKIKPIKYTIDGKKVKIEEK